MLTHSPRSQIKIILRLVRWTGVGVLALILILTAYLVIPVLPDPAPGFLPRKGQLQSVEITRQWTTVSSAFSEVTLTSNTGLQVQLTINRPREMNGPRPLVILMGGYVTGRRAAELIKNTHGIVIAAISYPYHGRDAVDNLSFLRNVNAIHQALLDTPPAVLLALDYLAKQEYVDPAHVELAGISFGAFLASIPGALDARFERVWLIHGGGDPVAVYDHMTVNRIKSGPLRWLLTRGFAILTQTPYLKPERWVGRISPRPVMVVHARNDPSYPEQSIVALDRALRQPYQIIWLGQEHIGVRSDELIQQMTDLIFEYISKDSHKR
jgi:dienelactone hydrolase